uniref:Uncharacterized protein n=1 Tax=Morchella importuna TaxID=1174673 RepID=A0A650AF42_9PEZI|nr:hypothetical protein [Morchella importuna]QGN66646.1 hypothetical protein [Morchella importuna]
MSPPHPTTRVVRMGGGKGHLLLSRLPTLSLSLTELNLQTSTASVILTYQRNTKEASRPRSVRDASPPSGRGGTLSWSLMPTRDKVRKIICLYNNYFIGGVLLVINHSRASSPTLYEVL